MDTVRDDGRVRLLLGRYQVITTLGAGAFGEVVQAWDPRIGRYVAIKSLRHFLATDPHIFTQARERFGHEAEAASRMGTHANIVTVHDLAADTDGTLYLILEYLPGGTLAERLKSQPASLADALQWTADAARGLHAAHQCGIVHRDIKPANLFLTASGRVKVGDFGIAQMDDLSGRSRLVIGHPGTPLYMSPEQTQTSGYLRGESDEYSLGLVLFELLTGVRYKELRQEELRTVLGKLPRRVQSVIVRMTAEQKEKRYRTLEDAAVALENLLQEMLGKDAALVSARPPRRWRVPIYGIAGIMGVSFIVILMVKSMLPDAVPKPTASLAATPTIQRTLTANAVSRSTAFQESVPTATAVPLSTATAMPTSVPSPTATPRPPTVLPTPRPTATSVPVQPASTVSTASLGQTWTDPNGRIKVQYPNGWRVTRAANSQNNLVEIISPDASGLAIDLYRRIGTPADEIQSLEDSLQSNTQFVFTFGTVTDIQIGGEMGKSVTYTEKQRDQPNSTGTDGVIWVVNHGTNAYLFDASDIGTHRAEIDAILATVVFT